MKFKKEGFAVASIEAITAIVIGVAMLTLIATVTGMVSGKVYSNLADDINLISSTEIKQDINDSVLSGFQAMSDTMDFVPTVVIVVMAAIIIAVFFAVTKGAQSGSGGGSAL